MLIGKGAPHSTLTPDEILDILTRGIEPGVVQGKRVLVLTPDDTRTAPLPLLVGHLIDIIGPRAAKLDFMVALGTHPPMADKAIAALYGMTPEEKAERCPDVGFLNHRWDLEGTLAKVGRLSGDEVEEISGGLFRAGVDVAINRAVLDYDLLIILGPVFPHEVAGFSGGNKYLFPGIAGGELLHFTHWLGAVVTCWETIGIRRTPVREAIDRAAQLVPTPRLCISMVVHSATELSGLYVGDTDESWTAATKISADKHIEYKDKPFHTVLGRAPEMYDEIWVAGKVMYKLEPVVADGGKLIIYGKHIKRVSRTWGELIGRVGYHVRDYFLQQMDRFSDIPLGVLAHSTHVKGVGTFENGVETPRVEVVLATSIPEEECRAINLGYMDPDSIDPADYQNKEDQGILYVHKAGEVLHRLKSDKR
ncbi:MAG: DUF2088 domain-containing protein [Desulfovibrio sp.]|nr:MAG: DUF2088 domain-containing protein [Desulfovibrio sp.]